MFFVLFQIFHKIIWQKKVSQNRQGLLFHGFMCLWLRNSGLRPSDSLAMTEHFISWNDTILSDVLLILFLPHYHHIKLVLHCLQPFRKGFVHGFARH